MLHTQRVRAARPQLGSFCSSVQPTSACGDPSVSDEVAAIILALLNLLALLDEASRGGMRIMAKQYNFLLALIAMHS